MIIKTSSGQPDLSIEQEIGCPSCHDVMTLHSEFDKLGYNEKIMVLPSSLCVLPLLVKYLHYIHYLHYQYFERDFVLFPVEIPVIGWRYYHQ
jgi:hypothetical protein